MPTCPKCHCEHMPVLVSDKRGALRQCRNCGHQMRVRNDWSKPLYLRVLYKLRILGD